MNNETYRIWDKNDSYGDLFYDRAIGKKNEMESAKAICHVISPFYKKKMKVLDVGCGVGHYLRSLRERLDNDIDYTGIDITKYYIERAKKAFPSIPFFLDDIHHMSFKDNSFDIVLCNNVVMHLPSPPKKAISELMRVSSRYVVIRTPFGARNYIIKEVKGINDNLNETDISSIEKECDLIDNDGNPIAWNYLNIYTIQYIKDIINSINKNVSITIIDDVFWHKLNGYIHSPTVTKSIGNKQVSGNIILDWKFVIIKKEG